MERTEQFKCLIWGTPAKLDDLNFVDGDVDCISSSRAGGMYLVPKTMEHEHIQFELSETERAALSYWIFQHTRNEKEIPVITEATLSDFIPRAT
jgi:hypothetical protein